MVEHTILRHLLSDNESLQGYETGQYVTIADIKRRTLLLERKENFKLPDQFYRLALERDFNGLDTLESLLSQGIYNIAKKYLDLDQKKVIVRPQQINDWQYLVTYIPPLLLKTSLLYSNDPPISFSASDLNTYFNTHLLPNALYTALPSPKVGELDKLLSTQNGFYDLHIHLNGTTEADIVWQDFLTNPGKVKKHFEDAYKDPRVREQFEQESHQMQPARLYGLVKIAQQLRNLLYDFSFGRKHSAPVNFTSLKAWLGQIVDGDRYTATGLRLHPFESIVGTYGLQNNMAIESLMYLVIFKHLDKKNNPTLASLFHFYLLILGLYNRLLVQQAHQYGFEQFQKNTLNQLREFSERKYVNRFFQIHGNELNQLKFIEGRFSPKQSEFKNTVLLNSIYEGALKFNRELTTQNKKNIDVKLVAHFIKKQDKKPDQFIRHKVLREQVWQTAKTLERMVRRFPSIAKRISGVDAASNELDSPPEVFAPTFRMLKRKKAFQHYTYHVGEDYYHLISGMRAIYEAVDFLNLSNKNRIGHGTAVGIDSNLWLKAIGANLLMYRGEWLDNLLFVKLLIRDHACVSKVDVSTLDRQILQEAAKIYSTRIFYSINDLIEAWQLRRFCPFHVLAEGYTDPLLRNIFDQEEWDETRAIKLNNAKELLIEYHDSKCREKYYSIISVDLSELFNSEDLKEMQICILKILFQRNVIIETLPTSNVRISHYNDYTDYHLLNWYKWRGFHTIPKIVIGTDDPGIFATNIYNEYANIFCQFTAKGISTTDVMNFIKELDQNSQNYSFK